MAAGDFSASQMFAVKTRQEAIFADPRSNRELKRPVGTVAAVGANQQVTWNPIMKGRNCVGVQAYWLKKCTDTVVDFTSGNALANCDISATQIESDSLTLSPTFKLRDTFVVYDDQCADHIDAQEKIAWAALRTKVALEEKLNQKVIAFLNANKMVNQFTPASGSIGVAAGTPAGSETRVDPAYWNEDIIAEFDLASEFNELNSPYIVNGTNLRSAFFNAAYNVRNDDEKDQIAKFQHFDMYFDSRVINGVTTRKSTFIIDSGALGLWIQNENANDVPESQSDRKAMFTWRENSLNLSYRDGNSLVPVAFDVYMYKDCTVASNGARRWGWFFEYNLRGGIAVGPADCNDGTGILEYYNAAA